MANGLLDFGLLVQKEQHTLLERTAVQTGADVQATQTRYTFTCGGVDLRLTFTAPLMPEDLELISRPVNYISYTITSNDGKAHDTELYLEASPRWRSTNPIRSRSASVSSSKGLLFVKAGSKEQNILAKSGDDLRIDWGYFLFATEADAATSANLGTSEELRRAFVEGTPAPDAAKGENERATMAFTRKLGTTKEARGKMAHRLRRHLLDPVLTARTCVPYWNAAGDRTIVDEFRAAHEEYDELIGRCCAFDRELMTRATEAGGRKYAELCALAYRQSFAAHKLVKGPDGELRFFSKENNSNGSIGTVDITYPSAPMYLLYNPELAKGMMNHIFDYSESGRWTKPFPAHRRRDLPPGPTARPTEATCRRGGGNMLILTAAVCAARAMQTMRKALGDAHDLDRLPLWRRASTPRTSSARMTSPDHFAHNANLSIKAILGIAAYGRMAEMLGKDDVAQSYTAKAREMAARWAEMADDGDHYRLTFDKPGTWSQKYNIVWDKLLGLGIFPDSIARKEIAYYLTRQNRYGLPLDSRETYTKTDWIVWTATLAEDPATFEAFISPLYDFMNETVDRVPMSDWVYTDKPNRRGFMARSVVGGYFIKMLDLNAAKEE